MQYQPPQNFNLVQPPQPPQPRQSDRSQTHNNSNKKPTFYEIVSEMKMQFIGTSTYRRMIEQKTSFKQNEIDNDI